MIPGRGDDTGDLATPALQDLDLRLRHAATNDIGFLYGVAARSSELWPRLCRQGLPNPQQFEQLAWSSVLVLYVVHHIPTNAQVGLATVHDPDHRNGTARVEVVLPAVPDEAEEAVTAAVTDHAFHVWGFRKVYLERDAFNPPAVSGLSRPWREEARLRNNVRHDNFLWDTTITAVYRDADCCP